MRLGEAKAGTGGHFVQNDHRHPVDMRAGQAAVGCEPADGPGRRADQLPARVASDALGQQWLLGRAQEEDLRLLPGRVDLVQQRHGHVAQRIGRVGGV